MSWIHLRPISISITTGFVQTTICSTSTLEYHISPIQSLSSPNFDDIFSNFTSCYTSSIIVLRELFSDEKQLKKASTSQEWNDNHHKILRCMLNKFEDVSNQVITISFHFFALLCFDIILF